MRSCVPFVAFSLWLLPLSAVAQPAVDPPPAAADADRDLPEAGADVPATEPPYDGPPHTESHPRPVATEVDGPAPDPEQSGAGPSGAELGDALRQREAVQPWHIAFGTATGLSSYGMTILGYLTYSDRYGFDGDENNRGCAPSGTPILGRESCTGPPIGHLVAVSTATTLFSVTFALSLFMPDPLGEADAGGSHATMLTVHKSLRWALLVLYAGQLVLGAVTSNLDPATDFGTRRDFATAHLAIGTVTMFTMTTQGVLGSLMEW